jgi:mRNA interferase MazF
LRPAVVLIVTGYDLTVSFITTQVRWREETDIELLPSKKSGIKKVSLIRLSKIATVDKSLVVGKLGEIQQFEMTELNLKLKRLLQLD